MNWIKIEEDKSIPLEQHLITDGITIERGNSWFLTGLKKPTHYLLLKDIPLPKQHCDSKCLRCKN